MQRLGQRTNHAEMNSLRRHMMMQQNTPAPPSYSYLVFYNTSVNQKLSINERGIIFTDMIFSFVSNDTSDNDYYVGYGVSPYVLNNRQERFCASFDVLSGAVKGNGELHHIHINSITPNTIEHIDALDIGTYSVYTTFSRPKKIASVELINNGVTVAHLVPDMRNGVVGMTDLLDLNFFVAANGEWGIE